METITKKDETTVIKEITLEVLPNIIIERTLDEVLADIAGTQKWLEELQISVLQAQSNIDKFNAEKKELEDLGIITKSAFEEVQRIEKEKVIELEEKVIEIEESEKVIIDSEEVIVPK